MERIDKNEARCPFSGGYCTWRCAVALQRILRADGRPVERRWTCGVAAAVTATSAASGLGYAPSYVSEDVVA